MKKLNTNLIFIIALAFLTLFFLNHILHNGVILDNVHYINDLTFVSYNLKESLKSNELPLWTPYFYAGHPLLAIPENYMLDLNFLFIFLFRNIYLAMSLALISYLFLSGLGMYLLMSNLTENKKAAFISAIIYMFNGLMHSFIMLGHLNLLEGYALIPFIFLFAHIALKSKEWIFYGILAGIFFALQILAGSMILFFYTALIVAIYFAINLISRNFVNALLKCVLVGAIIAAVALALSAVKLLPVLEFTEMSSRAINVSFREFLGNPVGLKDFFGIAVTNSGHSGISAALGVIGFILMIYGMSGYKKKIVIFSFALLLFSLLFASGTFVADLMYKIPGFEKLRHVERALVIFVFAGSVLASYGYILLSEKLKRFNAYIKHENLLFIAVIFLILLEILLLQKFPPSSRITEPNDIGLLEYMGNDNSTFRSMNIAMNDIIGAAGYNYYAQKGISEIKGGGGIWVNDYVNFVAVAQQSLNSDILGMANVKYVISGKEIDAGNLTLVQRFSMCHECSLRDAFGPYLYRNEHFLPRYYVAPNSILVVGDDVLARQLIYSLMFQNWNPENTVLIKGTKINDYSPDFLNKFDAIFLVRDSVDENSVQKLRDYVNQNGMLAPNILKGQNSVTEDDVISILNATKGNYTEIKIIEYSNNKVALNLNGEKGWLFVSERFAHFPGWKAIINNKNLELHKANNVMSAVYLEGDIGKLNFEYRPSSYGKGKIISIIALILILAYFGYFAYCKLKSPKPSQLS